MLTFSTSTPMFEPKRSESYTKCWLFPQCNRLRHTNIHGNCKCLYVRSTHQSATHAVIKTHRQLSSILRFPPALACSFWAILRPTKSSSTYGSSESSSNWLLDPSFFSSSIFFIFTAKLSFLFQKDCLVSTKFWWRSQSLPFICVRSDKWGSWSYVTWHHIWAGQLNGCVT